MPALSSNPTFSPTPSVCMAIFGGEKQRDEQKKVVVLMMKAKRVWDICEGGRRRSLSRGQHLERSQSIDTWRTFTDHGYQTAL